MKTELITAIGAAVISVLVAFFVTNLFTGEIEDVTVKTVENTVSTDLADPDPEVFNYNALNPTVEVYVGGCAEYDGNGQCIDKTTEEDIINIDTNTSTDDTTKENTNGSTD